MAVDLGGRENRRYRSVNQCLGEAFRYNGIASIYRGYVFSVVGAFIYRCLYFGLYDTIMECVRPEYAHKLWVEFPVAELSCTTAGIVSYPLDTVRRRMMVQGFNDHEPVEKGFKSVKYTVSEYETKFLVMQKTCSKFDIKKNSSRKWSYFLERIGLLQDNLANGRRPRFLPWRLDKYVSWVSD